LVVFTIVNDVLHAILDTVIQFVIMAIFEKVRVVFKVETTFLPHVDRFYLLSGANTTCASADQTLKFALLLNLNVLLLKQFKSFIILVSLIRSGLVLC